MNEFIMPWRECPGCDQYYQNELAVDIATPFVSFVRKQYPEDTPKQVEALHVKGKKAVSTQYTKSGGNS
jgi:hypothetical protein